MSCRNSTPMIHLRSDVLRRRLAALGVVAMSLLFGACATNPVTGVSEVSLVSEADEVKIGTEGDAQVRKEYGVYKSPALQTYVNEVGQKLARNSQRAQLKWHFAVLDSPQINAFALPGGFVYITRGLMAYLESEEELAGVLGHEVGHVTARHGAKRQTQGTIATVLAVGAEVLGQAVGLSGLGGAVGGVAGQFITAYGRDQELQADQLGARYLAANGYDPKGMIRVIQVLKNQELLAAERAKAEGRTPQKMPDWSSTHPSNDQRLREIVEIASALPAQGLANSGRERYLRAVNGMTFGDSREQGVVRGNSFIHEPLGIAFTVANGWKIINGSENVIAINAAGTVGAAMALVTDAGKTDEEIIRKLFNPQSGKAERMQINGMPATYYVGRATSRDGTVVPLEFAIIDHNNQKFLFRSVFKSVEARNASAAELRSTVTSFRALSAADRAQAKPYQVRTLPMPAGQTLASLGRGTPFGRLAEAELRVLNGVYPQGEIGAGQLVKVVTP